MDPSAIFWTTRLVVGLAGLVLMFGAVSLLGRARAAANWPTAPSVGVAARPAAYLGIGLGLLSLAAAAALGLAALVTPDAVTPDAVTPDTVTPNAATPNAATPNAAFVPHTWRAWLVGLGGGLVVIGIGAAATGRLVARAELTALIRTPPRRPDDDFHPLVNLGAGNGEAADDWRAHTRPELSTLPGGIDPVVPSGGQPGWVYRDPAGDWYLAVATDGGERGGERLVRLPDFTLVPVGQAGSPLTLAGSVQLSVWPVEERPAVADPRGRSGVPPHYSR